MTFIARQILISVLLLSSASPLLAVTAETVTPQSPEDVTISVGAARAIVAAYAELLREDPKAFDPTTQASQEAGLLETVRCVASDKVYRVIFAPKLNPRIMDGDVIYVVDRSTFHVSKPTEN